MLPVDLAIGQTVTMTYWKPHALAKPHTGQLDLRMGDRVESTVDLDAGVPVGTQGKVILANGGESDGQTGGEDHFWISLDPSRNA
jgi:hypothetical protein